MIELIVYFGFIFALLGGLFGYFAMVEYIMPSKKIDK